MSDQGAGARGLVRLLRDLAGHVLHRRSRQPASGEGGRSGPAAGRTAILVLGMHRGGTSASTGLIGHLGAALPADPIAAHRDNPKGFWESAAVVKADEEILRAARSSWFDPRPLDLSRLDASTLRACKDRLWQAIASAFGDEPLFVLKDPRHCRFVPLVVETLAERGVAARAALVLRLPAAVARSLARRDGTTPAFAHLLWLRHMIDAERASRALQRAVIDYDAMLEEGHAAAAGLLPLLGRERLPDDGDAAVIDAFLDPALRRSAEGEPIGLEPPLADIVAAVLAAFDTMRAQDDERGRAALDAAAARLDAAPWLAGDIIHDELRHRRVLAEQAARAPAAPSAREPAEPDRAAAAAMIRESGLFDEAWYAAARPDALAGGLDPIEHYLSTGAAEGRNPHPLFDTVFYARQMARRAQDRQPHVRAALVLHLARRDAALATIGRIARLAVPVDVIASYCGVLDPEVRVALAALAHPVETVAVTGRGGDMGALLELLPRLAARGCEVVCALTGEDLEAIGSDALVAAVIEAFAARSDLALLGPKALLRSAAEGLPDGAGHLPALALRLVAPAYPPADWQHFAGASFWGRRSVLEMVAQCAADDRPPGNVVEALVGLAPLATGGTIGLIADGAIEPIGRPGMALADAASGRTGRLPPDLAALVARRNPLIDYIRRGRDPDAPDPNPYFDSSRYSVGAAGLNPLQHYIRSGAAEGRATGPLFDGRFYRARYTDVAERGGDPLRHFIEVGAAEGRAAIPDGSGDSGGERPRRRYARFDLAREAAFLRAIAATPAALKAQARDMPVSVVMPAFNRSDRIGAAIRSVLAQSHRRFELLVVDDGSTDGTAEVVAAFAGDDRVRLIRGERQGVGAARNRALDAASGDLVAYLDSDNLWKPWFLEVMAVFMTARALEVAYCGIALRDGASRLAGYRGDDFDWEACLDGNYVDLNGFCHRRALVRDLGGFDPRIRRMVDWDLILRYGHGRRVGYAPFVGCVYHDDGRDTRRITVCEPGAFHALVRTKNRLGLTSAAQAGELAAKLRLSFAIKIAAPEADKAAWGDFHFAEALAAALRRLGHLARIDFRGAWHKAGQDVAIVLRGLIAYEPPPGQICFLWNISHPDQVDYCEYERFSRVYAASASHAALLEHILRVPVTALLQATDPERFRPADPPAPAPDILFVGNSRGVERDIVRWAIEAERPPTIYGGGWEGRVPPGLVAADNIDNARLGDLYAGAGVVLNDHWPSMRAFGLLSNRLFDIVASEGRAVSDPIPSTAATFGGAVREVDGPEALRAAVDELLSGPSDAACLREAAAQVRAAHSFDARARRFVADALAVLGLPAAEPPPPCADGRLAVHLIARHGPAGPQSSAFIRLLAPLTDDTVAGRVRVTIGRPEAPVPACDACIVQRAAFATVAEADALIARLDALGAPLCVDVDDAFALIGPDHPEEALYRPLNAALDRLIAAADETWFSTSALAAIYAGRPRRSVVIPNAIDPRLWRDWRRPRTAPFGGERVRMLYMGTHTHGADLAMIRPALERLAAERPGAFDLTLVGIAPQVEPAPWLRRLSPPADAVVYPRFVRWLRAQGPFDLGLAPLVDNAFNRAKSDIKALDYAALGMLPLLSDLPPYRADPDLGALAAFAGPDPEAWLAAFRGVLDRPADAAARAAALHEHV